MFKIPQIIVIFALSAPCLLYATYPTFEAAKQAVNAKKELALVQLTHGLTKASLQRAKVSKSKMLLGVSEIVIATESKDGTYTLYKLDPSILARYNALNILGPIYYRTTKKLKEVKAAEPPKFVHGKVTKEGWAAASAQHTLEDVIEYLLVDLKGNTIHSLSYEKSYPITKN